MSAQADKSHARVNVYQFVVQNPLNLLLLFMPVSIVLSFMEASKLWIFLAAALSIIPLAGLIGQATEEISEYVGPGIGGFLNATFGNATELIISLFALNAGLFEVVKASISGSIIGNILLVLGASMLAGGWGRDKQKFNRTNAGANASMLLLAVVALVMPAVFDLVRYGTLQVANAPADIRQLSLFVAVVLLLVYLASLVFSLKTHHAILQPEVAEPPQRRLTKLDAMILLIIATVLTAFMAEELVGAIEVATAKLGMTEFFVGVIVVAVIGNAAEHFT
ncbi:MAG TPA: calcium/proton exchanger, partial [Armatimonadota bacterium]|nr:calcium/proton exchanger [Armatimonadota bacterium]